MFHRSFISHAALALAAMLLPLSAASSATLAALTEDATLVMIDTATNKTTKTVKVIGVPGKLAGIDVRPADGMLYGLATDGTVVVIDTANGKATVKTKLETIPAAGTWAVDFNPVADRMRVIGSDGSNLRANVDDGKVVTDGKLKYAETDMHKGEAPNIVGAAYVNSFKGTKETALYDIDGTIGALIKQAPPNDGVLGAVGKLGMKSSSIAFDIESDGKGGNTAWLLADGALHTLDLATGKATMTGKVTGLTGSVRDIAVMPAM
jgi:hypothetical protein